MKITIKDRPDLTQEIPDGYRVVFNTFVRARRAIIAKEKGWQDSHHICQACRNYLVAELPKVFGNNFILLPWEPAND